MKIPTVYRIVLLCLAAALVSYGCARMQANGGGTLASTSGQVKDKANFGFEGNSCTPGVTTGTFNYHDKRAPGWPDGGVKLNGEVIEAAKCSDWDYSNTSGIACGICNLQFCNCPSWPDDWESCVSGFLSDPFGYCQDMAPVPDNLYGAAFQFQSTNPRYPGSGIGVACLTDNGQGKKVTDKDHLVLIVGPGQYLGYVNQGAVKGNIAAEPCRHDLCVTGFPLVSSSGDLCVAAVCSQDAHCCDTAWDQECVDKVQSMCGLSCAD